LPVRRDDAEARASGIIVAKRISPSALAAGLAPMKGVVRNAPRHSL
jgi:hypothetical protein